MNELEDEWSARLGEAEKRARQAGRGDVVDYLNLRAANDRARSLGVEWLFAATLDLVGEMNRRGQAAINFTRDDDHQFRVGQTTMVGSRLTLHKGIRSLTVEGGWPRAPQDGVMRGGGLALARLSHFGKQRHNEALLLVRDVAEATSPPQWVGVEITDNVFRRLRAVGENDLRRHLSYLQE